MRTGSRGGGIAATVTEGFVVGGAFGFVFGADAAGDGFARSESGAADLAFFSNCFSAPAEKRVQGMASRRWGSMGLPVSSQMP